ncbi:uncharacterized protein LOC121813854, partial [Haplochromis burtoni]|uniref:uncharacterized protein LOC121813854 n=1 Tax=Haplochromis burtoni TaxID=8153 RepID=UPI001C2DA9E9
PFHFFSWPVSVSPPCIQSVLSPLLLTANPETSKSKTAKQSVTQTCYQAEENHNITLEWTFTTKPDRSTKTLNILCELFISDKLSVLYHVHEGVEVSESQDEKFSGRVQSDKDALREGRIRLQLSRLRTDDSGLYLCEVNTDYGFSVGRCRLNVTAVRDFPESARKPKASNTESRGGIGLYCGLTAALLLCCFSFIYCLNNRISTQSRGLDVGKL